MFLPQSLGLIWPYTPLSCRGPGHPDSTLCCIFVTCRDELCLLPGQPLGHQTWLLGTCSGAWVFAGEDSIQAMSLVSPALLQNAWWKRMSSGMHWCFET